MPADVYLYRFSRKDPLNRVQKGIKHLFKKAGFEKIVKRGDLTAVKMHFGEDGNTSFLSAGYIEPIVRKARALGAKPFVTDTNVLYKSRRDNAVDHILLARDHGFSIETLGAPVIISDGIAGRNEIQITIDAPINKNVWVASDIVTANSILVITHVTGHLITGMGGVIKNLGMGMSSRKGKLVQHSVSKPEVKSRKCVLCKTCIECCPSDAIVVKDKYAFIIEDKCIGCGECLAMCRFNAIKFKWDSSSELIQKQIAEHALGVVRRKKDRIGYFSFMISMTRDCDCLKQHPNAVINDIGVLAGKDPVAIDQAALDLTRENSDKNISEVAYPEINGEIQLEYGEKIGLGRRQYNLVEINLA